MKITILILLIFCPVSGYSRQGPGSAKTLKGNIYVLCCFVSDQNHEWSSRDKREIFAKYREAAGWIRNQAAKYNDTVNFTAGSYGMDANIKLDHIQYGTGSRNEDAGIISRVLQEVGYRNSLSFYNWVTRNTNCDNALVLIFVKGRGRGYAVICHSESTIKQLDFMEGAVLFEKQSTGAGLSSSSIAHEILHLFGAWDFYRTFEQTQEREDRAKQMFPNSIMLRTSPNIHELTVDRVTAWLIGWKSDPEPWYGWFRPGQR
jgi:hypothetical protein